MGTWGIGNFDSDDAGGFLDEVYEFLVRIIYRHMNTTNSPGLFLEYHGESKVMPAIDVITTLYRRYGVSSEIELDTLVQWRQQYLRMIDEHLAEAQLLHGKPDTFYEARRKVVDQTFQELIDLITEWENRANGA